MAKFSVMFMVHASMIIKVDAKNEAEARQLAEDQAGAPNVCHMCSSRVQIDALGDILEVSKIK